MPTNPFLALALVRYFEYEMIMKPHFLFFTGEPAVTMRLLEKRPSWSPVLSALQFDVTNGRVHRPRSAEDHFRGVVYFADVRDKEIEQHNLRVFANHSIPCWPAAKTLLGLSDRHAALAQCVRAGLVDHPVVQSLATPNPVLPFPYVLKVGDEHRGEGKYLIQSPADIPKWEGMATMEPFFQGESVRVLILGNDAFGARIVHDTHWVKNAPGGRIEPWRPDDEIVNHARKVISLFGLEIAGVDYVIDGRGFHFLEVNPFPRVGLSKESAALARQLFHDVMDRIEKQATRNA